MGPGMSQFTADGNIKIPFEPTAIYIPSVDSVLNPTLTNPVSIPYRLNNLDSNTNTTKSTTGYSNGVNSLLIPIGILAMLFYFKVI